MEKWPIFCTLSVLKIVWEYPTFTLIVGEIIQNRSCKDTETTISQEQAYLHQIMKWILWVMHERGNGFKSWYYQTMRIRCRGHELLKNLTMIPLTITEQ